VRDDAIRSHEYKIKKGEWPHKAPIGYLNARSDSGQSTVILDPERAPLVRRMFVEYAKGIYSIQAITRMVNQWGLRNKSKRGGKIPSSQVYQVLTNPFYYGVMVEKGEHHNHIHPRLIDKTTWDKCQETRESYGKKPFAYAAKPVTFRGILTCGDCGSAYTTEQKKGKYNYLFCTKNKDKNCPAPRMKEEDVFEQAVKVLDQIAIPENVLAEVRKHLADNHQAKNEFHNTALKNLKQQLTQIDRKRQKLWDLYLKADDESHASITHDELDKILRGLNEEKKEIETELKSHEGADDDYYISLNLLLELVQNAGELFRKADVDQKRKILKLVYWNLELRGGTLCYSLRKPFDLFLNTDKNKNWLA
jgi:site-specific DNA recombinase